MDGTILKTMEEVIDLFEQYETLPQEVQYILLELEDPSYVENERLLKLLRPLGYTFEYGLCATPYDLTKIK